MLTTNYLFILTKSVNCSVNLFSNQKMNSATVSSLSTIYHYYYWTIVHDDFI